MANTCTIEQARYKHGQGDFLTCRDCVAILRERRRSAACAGTSAWFAPPDEKCPSSATREAEMSRAGSKHRLALILGGMALSLLLAAVFTFGSLNVPVEPQ